MNMVTITILEWALLMALVVSRMSVMVKLRCGCLRMNVPDRNYCPLLMSIRPKTLMPELENWTCWIKKEIYSHFIQNLLTICMSLCLTISQDKKALSLVLEAIWTLYHSKWN
jgi:hypothetical protein